MKYFRVYFVFLCLVFVSLPGQNYLLSPMADDHTQIRLTFGSPSFDTRTEYSLFTGIYNFYACTPLSEGLNFAVNVPIAGYSWEYESYGDSETGIGNISLALLGNNDAGEDSRLAYGGGIYLPSASQDIAYMGVVSNYYRISDYLYDATIIYGQLGYEKKFPNNLFLGFEILPNYAIANGDREDSEFYLQYGGAVGVRSEKVGFTVELGGIRILTGDYDEEDRSTHQMNMGVSYNFGITSAGLSYMFYFDDEIKDNVDGVLGIQLVFNLAKQ